MVVSIFKAWFFATVILFSSCSPGPEQKVAESIELTASESANIADTETQVVEPELGRKPVNIYGTMQSNQGVALNTYVYLFETEGRDYFVVDSAKVENNSFKWQNLDVEAGIYKIGFSDNPNELFDIVLSSLNDSVSFLFSNRDLRRSFQSTNSTETTAWREYLKAKGQHDQYIESIRKSNLSSEEKRKSIYAREADFKKVQTGLASKAEGSYFAKVMRHLQSDNRFEQPKFWSDLDFKDPSLIHSTVFPDRIEDYMRLHGSKSTDPNNPVKGFYSAVDDIANKIISDGDTRVLEFVLYTMSEGFYSSGMEELSLYVVDNYFYGDACGDQEISELFRMKAAGIQNLKVGSTAPDFSIKASTGRTVSLKDVSAQNKLTLVLFWASFCHRCEREIPELKAIYNQKKSKGFEVLAVSVDSNEKDFMKGISAAGTTWNNGCDYQSWRGPIAKDYRVTSTPVMFLVNSQREILAKPKSVAELNTYLARLAL